MTTTQVKSNVNQFLHGARIALPVVVALSPFALLFGTLAADNGLSVLEATLMSASIYGGASQMVGVELFSQDIPAWLVVLSIFAVNFRHVLYSAAVGRRIAHWTLLQKATGFFFLVDPVYAETEQRAERGGRVGFAWYMGVTVPIYLSWVVASALGAFFGRLISNPQALGFDFLLPIYFLGLVMGFRKRALWLPVVAASAAASILAFKFIGSPWHVSVGALAGIALAAAMTPGKATPGSSEAGKSS